MADDGNRRDLQLDDDRWTPIDVLADCPEYGDVQEFLHAQGWEVFLELGSTEDAKYLTSWQRGHPQDDGTDQHLLQIGGQGNGPMAPFLLFGSGLHPNYAWVSTTKQSLAATGAGAR